jgi:hypothetical protein
MVAAFITRPAGQPGILLLSRSSGRRRESPPAGGRRRAGATSSSNTTKSGSMSVGAGSIVFRAPTPRAYFGGNTGLNEAAPRQLPCCAWAS